MNLYESKQISGTWGKVRRIEGMLGFSIKIEPMAYMYRYIKQNSLWKLAHVIMEAYKTHNIEDLQAGDLGKLIQCWTLAWEEGDAVM